MHAPNPKKLIAGSGLTAALLGAFLMGCVRIGTALAAQERAGRRKASTTAHQAVANSARTAAQRTWKRPRRSASEKRAPLRVTARKY